MRTSDFDYDLPEEHIAQRPASPRDSSRLMVLDRTSGDRRHHFFTDLPAFLGPNDLLILNETRVIPARLHGVKVPTGGKVEILLLKRLGPARWETIVGGRGLGPGQRVSIHGGPEAVIRQDLGGSKREVEFDAPISDLLNDLGEMPLPPYVREPLQDRDEYQTVFAQVPGSTAAPTAGLHFTTRLLEGIRAQGARIHKVVLHIGLDTFLPVEVDDPSEHPIHSEWCQLGIETAEAVNAVRAGGGRVIAVGTTTVRTLETAAREAGNSSEIGPFEGPTDLYILPPYEFKIVDAILTNFHLPRSTLLMMISAFAGRERILDAYAEAIEKGYRFYSFGDAMLIL